MLHGAEYSMASSDIPPELLAKFRDPAWGSEQLSGISLLKCFDHEQLIEIYRIGEIHAIKRACHAVIEGENTRGLYLLLFGALSVYKNDPTGENSHRLAGLEEGDSFGELSLFDESPRSATVMADTLSYVFLLDAKNFESYLTKAGPETTANFYRTCAIAMSEKLRALNSEYITSQQLLWKYALNKADRSAS